MTTPTQNGIPSSTAIDVRFNAEKLDEIINSDENTYTDRFGNQRLTAKGVAAAVQETLNVLTGGDGSSIINLPYGGKVSNLQTFLSCDMFGIENTGDVDVTDKLLALIQLSTLTGIPIKQKSGEYLISGNAKFNWIIDNKKTDLGGMKIIPAADFTGTFWISQSSGLVKHASGSSVVTKLNANASTDFLSGNGCLDSLGSDTTLNDSMVIMNFSDDLYVYNNTQTQAGVKNQKLAHVTRISANGKMDNVFPYNGTSITSISALPIQAGFSEFIMPDVDYRYGPRPIFFQFFYVSNLIIKEGRILNKPITEIGSRHVIDIQYYYNTYVDFIYDAHPTASFSSSDQTTTYASYTLHHGWGAKLYVRNVNAFGYGWGSISAAGWIADTIFDNCSANNFDSHNPSIGYYKLVNCKIGDGAAVFLGTKNSTLEILDTVYELGRGSGDPYYGNFLFPSLVQARTTSGGITDGTLIMRNVRVRGFWKYYSLASNGEGSIVQGAADKYTSLPTGSQMAGELFNKIDIDGLTIETPEASSCLQNIYWINRDGTITPPMNIRFDNVTYAAGGTLKIDFTNTKPRASNTSASTDTMFEPIDMKVSMNNVGVDNLIIKRPSYGFQHNIRLDARRLHNPNYNGTPTLVRISQRGSYNFNDCELSGFITNDGTQDANQRVEINMSGGSIKSGTNLALTTTDSSFRHRLKASGVSFSGDYSLSSVTASNLNLAQWFRLSDCSYYDNSGIPVSSLMIWNTGVNNSSWSGALYVAKGNCLQATHLQSGNTFFDVFTIDYPGSGILARSIGTNITSSVNTLSGTTSVSVSGTNYSGSSSTQMNSFIDRYTVGTRGVQAYISGIFSQLSLTSIYVS